MRECVCGEGGLAEYVAADLLVLAPEASLTGAESPQKVAREKFRAIAGLVVSAGRARAARGEAEQHRIARRDRSDTLRSEEHTSELQSLMRTSYAVFCLQKKQNHQL